jgi:hypothetical protein
MNRARALAWLLAVTGWLFAPDSLARVFAGIPFGDGADPMDPRRMDIHAPERPGPHPLVVLAGVAQSDSLAGALAERGYVVAVLAPEQAVQPRELARALAWLYWRGGSYAADPARLHVVAQAGAADAALALGLDRGLLADGRVPDGTLHALAVLGWNGRLPQGARRVADVPPPLQVVPAGAEAGALQAAGRLAEQWRSLGGAAEMVELASTAGGVEAALEMLERWLATALLQRVPRYESLRWREDPTPLPAPSIGGLLGIDGHLLAVAGDAQPTVWRRDGAQAPWQHELDAGPGRVMWFGHIEATADTPTAGLLLADDQRLRLLVRDDGASRWSTRIDLGGVPSTARAGWLVSLPAAADGRRALVVAIDAGAESRVVLRQPDGRITIEAPGTGERISGLALLGGQAYLAVIGPGGGRLLRRVGERSGAWVTAAAWPGVRGALDGLGAPAPDAQALLGMFADGSMVRIDPTRGEWIVEADLPAAFARPWGPLPAQALSLSGTGWLAQVHPHSGDRAWLVGMAADQRDGSGRGGWYLVRQASGHYAYGQAVTAADGRGTALRALAGSPFVADGGAVLYALAAGAGAAPRLLRGEIPEPRQPAGFWADRAHADRGLVLARTRAGWVALLFRREADGVPRWYSGGGRIIDGQWQDATALVRHRRTEPGGTLHADDVGRIAIRFGVDATDPACAGTSRAGAWALAVLEVDTGSERVRDCIEPQRRADASRPLTDPTGIWMAPDGRWGMAVQSLGYGLDGDEQALVFHFDVEGLPRWAFARGARRDGRTALVLQAPDALQAGALSYAFEGACGRVAGSASLQLSAPGAGSLRVADASLLRAAGDACY